MMVFVVHYHAASLVTFGAIGAVMTHLDARRGGMRFEINAGGYRNYEPDWETVRYEPQQGSNVFYKNLSMPHSMFESFPPIEIAAEHAEETKAATGLFE